jgi:hypothetical protein
MTAAATPAGNTTASSSDNSDAASYAQCKGFDGAASATNVWTSVNPTAMPQWLQRGFSAAQTWSHYTLTKSGLAAPTAWELRGSNDVAIGAYTVVDSRSGISWTAPETKRFKIASPGSAQYYRIHITAVDEAAAYAAVGDLRFEKDYPVLDLRAAAISALTAPTRASLLFAAILPEGAVLNTDLQGYVSRDGGTTWTQVRSRPPNPPGRTRSLRRWTPTLPPSRPECR